MGKIYRTRKDRLVLLSKLFEDYIISKGDVSKTQLKRMSAYKVSLIAMREYARLKYVAASFLKAIKAAEKGDFDEVARNCAEALAFGETVI